MSTKSSSLRVALCQIDVGADKVGNITHAHQALQNAKAGGASLAVLPECWNSPYSTASFPLYAEPMPEIGGEVHESTSPSSAMLVDAAKSTGMWLIGGSIPERDSEDKLYNTCLVVNPDGAIVGKHRKMHLFDIDVPGRIKFKESEVLTGGNDAGCNFLVYPGAFNMTTGRAHWDLLQRARAVDNNVFVATCSPARDTSPDAGYVAWGHSSVYSPWGELVSAAGEGQETVFADLNLEEADAIREQIPCWKQKRTDLYIEVSRR
eukprot:GSChrysophyteH1.ASY1.ANO1.2771.1 assembled CDS